MAVAPHPINMINMKSDKSVNTPCKPFELRMFAYQTNLESLQRTMPIKSVTQLDTCLRTRLSTYYTQIHIAEKKMSNQALAPSMSSLPNYRTDLQQELAISVFACAQSCPRAEKTSLQPVSPATQNCYQALVSTPWQNKGCFSCTKINMMLSLKVREGKTHTHTLIPQQLATHIRQSLSNFAGLFEDSDMS